MSRLEGLGTAWLSFLTKVPAWFRDLYVCWSGPGGDRARSSLVRFAGSISSARMYRSVDVPLRKGRYPRRGGLEAPPKTGERIVDCSYDPEIFRAFRRVQKRSLELGRRDYVFTETPAVTGVAPQEGVVADASRRQPS
jgi:hypothetical protein